MHQFVPKRIVLLHSLHLAPSSTTMTVAKNEEQSVCHKIPCCFPLSYLINSIDVSRFLTFPNTVRGTSLLHPFPSAFFHASVAARSILLISETQSCNLVVLSSINIFPNSTKGARSFVDKTVMDRSICLFRIYGGKTMNADDNNWNQPTNVLHFKYKLYRTRDDVGPEPILWTYHTLQDTLPRF